MLFTQKCYAEENSTDNGNYEFTIPSEVSVSQKDGKLEGAIPVTVTTHNRKWLSVNIESENDFKLIGKTGKQKISYQLSDTSFDINPQYAVDNDDATTKKEIILSSSKVTNIADDYSDSINFVVSSVDDTRTIVLDCNGGNVNGQSDIKYTVKNGQTYGQLPRPYKTGSLFVSWIDQDGNSIYSGSQVTAETEKLTAKFSQIFSISVQSIVNGKLGNYFKNCGKAELYINGEKYTENQDFLYCTNLKEGDTFKVDNIRATDGYVYTGFNCSEGADKLEFEYYDDGSVKSISGTFTKASVTLYFDFESDSVLQRLIRKYSLDTIIIDSDKPSDNTTSLGSLGLFASSDAYYIDGITMHIYNPDSGKVIAPESLEGIFTSLTIKNMDLRGLDTANVKRLVNCFAQDYWLETLDVSNWNTSNLIDGKYCFWNTTSLQSLDLTNWDTSNLKFADSMLAYTGVSDLSSIENWNVEKLQRSSNMLSGNINLKSLDLSNWKTPSLTASNGMFWNLKNIEYLNVTGLDFSKCDSLGYTFGGMYKLKKITGLETLDFSNIRFFHTAFGNLYEMEELNLPYINFDIVVQMNNTFANDTKLKSLTFENFHITKDNYDMTSTFYNCKSLKNIYTNTSKDVISYIPAVSTNMFLGCESLVGGSGTTYDPAFVDATAARIDGGSNSPGYFTNIADKFSEQALDTGNDDVIIKEDTFQNDIQQDFQLQEIYNPELDDNTEE